MAMLCILVATGGDVRCGVEGRFIVAENTYTYFFFWLVVLLACMAVIVLHGEDFVNKPKLHQD